MAASTWAARRDDFQRDGFVIARGVLAPADLQPVRADLEILTRTVAAKRGLRTSSKRPVDFETGVAYYEAVDAGFGAALHEEMGLTSSVAALWRHPRLLDAVHGLSGWRAISAHPIFNIRPKSPSGRELNYGMHQDPAFWNDISLGIGVVACWLPLVNVTRENGTLQLIRGSHSARKLYKHVLAPDGSYAPFIPDDQMPPGERVLAELSPGDAVFFQEMTVHGGCGPNKSQCVRWAIDLRWQSPSDVSFLSGRCDTVKLWDDVSGCANVDVPSWAAHWREQECIRKSQAAWKNRWLPLASL